MKKEKNNNGTSKLNSFIKRLIKLGLYFVLVCFVIYLVTWVIADRIIESHKMDTGEMISDILEDIPQK